MIECAANCIPDNEIIKGFEYSYKYLGNIAKAMDELQKDYGKTKVEFTTKEIPDEILKRIKDTTLQKIDEFYEKIAKKGKKINTFNI